MIGQRTQTQNVSESSNMWLKILSAALLLTVVTSECPAQYFWTAKATIPGTHKVLPVYKLINEAYFHIADQHIPVLCENTKKWKLLFDLKITNSQLQTITPGAFNKMNLLYLSLSNNMLTTIPSGVFNTLHSIKSIDLSSNSIEHIEETAFDDLPKLQAINFNNNKIQTLNSNWFKNGANLHKIYLKNNQVMEIPQLAFKYLTENTYTTVVLMNNKITKIHSRAFANFKRYGSFWLSHNQIADIPSDMFDTQERNFELNLDNNRINFLSESALDNIFSSCKILDITNNPLACSTVKNMHKYFHKENGEQHAKLLFDDKGRCRHDMRYLLRNIPLISNKELY